MKKRFTYDEVFAEFRRFVESHPTKTAAAESLGISKQYLNDLLKATRPITDAVYEQLGFSKHQDTFSKAS